MGTFIYISAILVVLFVEKNVRGQASNLPSDAALLFETTTHVGAICSRCTCLSLKPYSVDCNDMNLKQMPKLRGDLYMPWHFKLESNALTEIPPFPEVPKLSNLTGIIFRYNKISSISDAAFSHLSNLVTIDLSHNLLTEQSINSKVFVGQYKELQPDPLSLKSLSLSFNSFSRLPKHVFKHLTSLTSLDLSHNPFGDLSYTTTQALTDLQNLTILNLSYTRLLRLPNHFFSELQSLVEVNLSGNEFVVIPQEINYAMALQTLHLNNNKFKSITPGIFWERLGQHLSNLSITHCEQLRVIEDKSFSNLTKLRKLHLSQNKILSRIEPLAFTADDNIVLDLEEVYLQENDLQHIPAEALRWNEIIRVDLQGNPWNCDCKMKWLATEVALYIEKTNYDLSVNLKCASPIDLQGKKMVLTAVQNSSFLCEDKERTKMLNSFVHATIAIVATLSLISAFAFIYIMIKKSKVHQWVGRNVKYRRTYNTEDDDLITSTDQQ